MQEVDSFKNKQRPMSCRPKTSIPKQAANKEPKDSDESSLKDITESELADQSSSKSLTSKGNFDILDSVMKGKQKENFENLIKEEANRLELIHKQKKNLKNINLYEKNIDGLYDWKTLFNNSRPLSSYTKPSNTTKINAEESKKSFQFPIALIDATEEHVAQYIPHNNNEQVPNKKGNNYKKRPNTTKARSLSDKSKNLKTNNKLGARLGNATRPQSMYSTREKTDTFYLSKPFSDYYNEDLKTFSKKMPLLQAKIPIQTKKLKKALKDIKKQTKIKDEIFKMYETAGNFYVSPLEINIAGNMKNCEPLLKSIYRQTHSLEDDIEFDPIKKIYPNTAKPLGNSQGEVDYSQNNRHAHIEEFKKLRDGNRINPKRVNSARPTWSKTLNLETYDENDPDVQIFQKIEEKSIEEEYDVKHGVNNLITNNDLIEENSKLIDHQKNGIQLIDKQIGCSIPIKQRPKTGLVLSKDDFGGKLNRIKESKARNRPLTSINQLNTNKQASIDIKMTYPNLNSSGSIQNTCASSFGIDYIPTKGLPIRTSSAISNRTYRKINNQIKNKLQQKKDNYLYTDNWLHDSMTQPGMTDANIQVSSRPKTSIPTNDYIKNKLEKINRNQKPEWNPVPVNDYYFNNYIDTTFLPITPYNQMTNATFKHYNEQNYFHTNCFNKGTCGRELPGKRKNLFSESITNTKHHQILSPKT